MVKPYLEPCKAEKPYQIAINLNIDYNESVKDAENMDTIRLLQALGEYPQQDVIQYHITSQFLQDKSYEHLIKLLDLLDYELKHDYQLSSKQKACIQYLFRDWAHSHIKSQLTPKETKAIFLIDGIQQAPGHFMEAIDFAKRNPKDNEPLMRLGLMLLIHSAKITEETKTKIHALEQLISEEKPSTPPETEPHRQELKFLLLLAYNILAGLYCLWMLTKTTYPAL